MNWTWNRKPKSRRGRTLVLSLGSMALSLAGCLEPLTPLGTSPAAPPVPAAASARRPPELPPAARAVRRRSSAGRKTKPGSVSRSRVLDRKWKSAPSPALVSPW